MYVILGTPHGSNVAGKRSPDGSLLEYAYGRKVVNETKKRLETLGYTVFIDMPQDVVPTPQKVELQKRVAIVNNICAKYGKANCIYVSIHVNGAGNKGQWENAGGWCCFTTRGTTKSDKLACCLYEAADDGLIDYAAQMSKGKANGIYSKFQRPVRIDISDGDPDLESNFYVISHTTCPAVLTENLFQDNKWDVAFLNSEAGFEAIVNIHIKGIVNFIKIYGK